VERVHGLTGRYPGLYSGHYLGELLGDAADPLLRQCWLWTARYGSRPVVPRNWPTWTLWQYTDGAAGPEPHSVKGIGQCDRNTFNGGEAQLRRLWGAT
jgi:lysozyme